MSLKYLCLGISALHHRIFQSETIVSSSWWVTPQLPFFGVSNVFPVKFPSSVPTYSCLLFSHWSLLSGSNISSSLLFRLSLPLPCVAHLSSIPAPTAISFVAISAPGFWRETGFGHCSWGLRETLSWLFCFTLPRDGGSRQRPLCLSLSPPVDF